MKQPHLYYFGSGEFTRAHKQGADLEDWWPVMSVRLLVLLDALRTVAGQPLRISAAPGAIGRHLGDSDSQHNIDRWGEVRAVDVMAGWIETPDHAAMLMHEAKRLGFTGVGVYPHWRPDPGLHLDVRVSRKPGDAAEWGGVNDSDGVQQYVTVDEALDDF